MGTQQPPQQQAAGCALSTALAAAENSGKMQGGERPQLRALVQGQSIKSLAVQFLHL